MFFFIIVIVLIIFTILSIRNKEILQEDFKGRARKRGKSKPKCGWNNSFRKTQWTNVFSSKRMGFKDLKNEDWKDALQDSKNQIIWRQCWDCKGDHRNIFYRRLTPWGNINIRDLFIDTWKSNPKGGSNVLNKDFELYPSYIDAVKRNKNCQWKFCNYNDRGIGFPRDCGPNGPVGGNWKSWSPRVRDKNSRWRFNIERSKQIQCAATWSTDYPVNNQPGGKVDKKHICDEDKPICRDYIYNKQWGKCRKATPKDLKVLKKIASDNLLKSWMQKAIGDKKIARGLFNNLENRYKGQLDYLKDQDKLMLVQLNNIKNKEKKLKNLEKKVIQDERQLEVNKRSVKLTEEEDRKFKNYLGILTPILGGMCVIILLMIFIMKSP